MNPQHSVLLKGLANNIKKHRNEQRLSQEDLAELAGMSRDYLARIETGRDSPSLGILTQIAGALRISVSQLLSEHECQPLRVEERVEMLLQPLSDEDKKVVLETCTALAASLRKRS